MLVGSLCLALSSSGVSYALDNGYQDAFTFWLNTGVKKKYSYVWGAYDPTKLTYDTRAKAWKRGLDCSGFIYWAGRKAAIPGIRRTTSYDMAHGGSGWTGDTVSSGLRGAQATDIVWWTLSKDRPFGHVGVLLHNASTGFPGVAHASSSRGVVMDEIQGWVTKQMVRVRRLTIGDKK